MHTQTNCVLGGTADSLTRREVGYWGGLQRVQADRDLVDVYRELHPIGREITHAGTQSAARLDRWLVSSSLFGRLRAADVGVGVDQLPSDHRAVYVALRAGRQRPALGRGPWRFSLDLLQDEAYMDATFFFFFLGRKVMPYSTQRKAAKQVMQNLGDGTTPQRGGPGKEVLGQSSTHVRRQNRTATAQGM